MPGDAIQKFIRLGQALRKERDELQERLKAINAAFPADGLIAPAPAPQPQAQSDSSPAKANNASLKESILGALASGPLTKEEILETVKRNGYRFKTANPLNSMALVLYGNKPRLSRIDGKFALPQSATSQIAQASRKLAKPVKRTMSPEGRARIAAAARRRWKKAKAAGMNRLS